MLLGALIKEMHRHGLAEDRPIAPFLGHSVDSLSKTLLGFSTPVWYSEEAFNGYAPSSQEHTYTCNLKNRIEPSVRQIVKGFSDVKLMN